MDIREHPPVRPLTTKFLNEAQKVQQNAELQPKAVILAPFGLAATLTGNSFKTLDNQTQKILDDWAEFYPLCNNRDNSDLPPVVEVVSGE
jgi:mediator of RNA polymerase II transcription subunit 13